MSRTIKVDNQVYEQLEQLRRKRETFSQAVDRLLKVYETLSQAVGIMEGQVSFIDWQREQLEKMSTMPGTR